MEEEKNSIKTIYQFTKKRKKRLALFGSLLILVLLLGVNVYAWFVYIAKSDLTLSANVIGWTVTFSDGTLESDNLKIDVIDAYPGMTDFAKRIYITNSSEFNSTFRYEIDNIEILGQNVLDRGLTQEQIQDILKNTYPFSIGITFDKTELASGQTMNFDTSFSWKYDNDREYFKLDKYHTYDPNVKYYSYNGTNYTEENVTRENFSSMKNSLYMYKDDADGFFGIKCADYEEKNNDACVKVKLKLFVEQAESAK